MHDSSHADDILLIYSDFTFDCTLLRWKLGQRRVCLWAWVIQKLNRWEIFIFVNSPIMHLQNFKQWRLGEESSPTFTGELCASSLTYQWTVYTVL